jgi:hypothetical protein
MPTPLRAVLPVVLTFCLAQAGCHTFLPHNSTSAKTAAADQAAAATLRPGTLVAWTVTGVGQPPQGTSGRSRVGTDGKLALGPLGSVAAAGLTVAKAETAAERQLRHYLKDPKVHFLPLATQSLSAGSIVEWTSDGEVRPVAYNSRAQDAWQDVPGARGGWKISNDPQH